MRVLLVVVAVFLLAGCTTAVVEPTSPYTLSPTEIKAVVSGINSAVKYMDSPDFRKFTAATSEDGHIYVCGWLSYQKRGYYTGEQPFFGTMFAGQFVPERFGTDGVEISKVLSACHAHGIQI